MPAGAPPPGTPPGGSGPDPARDPGLQPERTRLAWRRTTLSATVAAVLAARQAIHGGGTPAGLAVVALGALVWLAFLVAAHRRSVALSAARPPRLSEGTALTAAACTICLAAFAVTLLM